MEELRSKLNSIYINSNYYLNGTCDVPSSNMLFVNDELKLAHLGPLNSLERSRIKNESKISAFGDLVKKETVYDENVRLSNEIDMTDLYIYEKNHDGFKEIKKLDINIFPGIDEEITKEIGPVQFKAHKLVLYEKESFFKEHVDTLENSSHIGTLLISLSNFYEGGNFIIRHNNNSKSLKLNMGDWCFFYSNCAHEVTKITIILSFKVFVHDFESSKLTYRINTTQDEKIEMFFKEVESYLYSNPIKYYRRHDNLSFKYIYNNIRNFENNYNYQFNDCFAIVLDHKYASSYPNESDDSFDFNQKNLKVSDKKIYDYVKNNYKFFTFCAIKNQCYNIYDNEKLTVPKDLDEVIKSYEINVHIDYDEKNNDVLLKLRRIELLKTYCDVEFTLKENLKKSILDESSEWRNREIKGINDDLEKLYKRVKEIPTDNYLNIETKLLSPLIISDSIKKWSFSSSSDPDLNDDQFYTGNDYCENFYSYQSVAILIFDHPRNCY